MIRKLLGLGNSVERKDPGSISFTIEEVDKLRMLLESYNIPKKNLNDFGIDQIESKKRLQIERFTEHKESIVRFLKIKDQRKEDLRLRLLVDKEDESKGYYDLVFRITNFDERRNHISVDAKLPDGKTIYHRGNTQDFLISVNDFLERNRREVE